MKNEICTNKHPTEMVRTYRIREKDGRGGTKVKSVLRSIKPYWLYLMLIGKKSVEVGKDCPKSNDWNRVVELYCSKDKKSFNRIPEKDKEWMRKYIGKVACWFVCENINEFHEWQLFPQGIFQESEQEELNLFLKSSCLSFEEICTYRGDLPYFKPIYAWHISDLVIYDKPKELSEFKYYNCSVKMENGYPMPSHKITRPPQSWCYVDMWNGVNNKS